MLFKRTNIIGVFLLMCVLLYYDIVPVGVAVKIILVRCFKLTVGNGLAYVQYTPPTRRNCRVASRRRCVHNSQLVGDSFDESEQICRRRIRQS